ncbi:DUF4304 domain-containing protein [Luteimonas sp. M1R5S18]|uniref:DUF4304 domain-containing protein n=1 Tax=Luteimonas rhizosphaericola TaxID=3042024 RepID=A0ABT6JKU2_9GAMM|nr:DUF4304 domain-containing protein [Luteimonas rhizosphaericola]MDH5831254.1 DUF4304 domain-containing protein [Luteimonas rhizosphaericola]
MTHTRDEMQAALKATLVPYLRSVGFRGSLPHFHRVVEDHVDLLTVQYYSAGSCLLVEISSAKNDGAMEPSKQRVYFHGKRLRLHRETSRNDHWFCYTPYGMFSPMQEPQEIAEQLRDLVQAQAEAWWLSQRALGS